MRIKILKILLIVVIILIISAVYLCWHNYRVPEIPPSATPSTNPPAPPENEIPKEENELEENGSIELEKPPFLK